MKLLLTIAIPTFDRNELLRKHVAELLPQLTAETRLIILDNASPIPVQQTLDEMLSTHPPADVRIIRHRVNIGSSANVTRCFELCETPWLWVLGDDDRPLENAVTLALTACRQHSKCLLISTNGIFSIVQEEFVTDGLTQFVQSIPHFTNLTLISSNLYQVQLLTSTICNGYYYAYSLFPHLAIVLCQLANGGGRCCFSPLRLIEWGPVSEWSRILAAKGVGTILDIPMDNRDRKKIAMHLVSVSARYTSLAIHLLDQIGVSIDRATAQHIYSQAWHRYYRFDLSLLKYWRRLTGSILLRFPSLGKTIYQRYRSLRKIPKTGAVRSDMERN